MTHYGKERHVHQDQRIGLALAVLLLGAAGAFFFRNDPKPAGTTPRLKSGRELDAQIAEKSITPYFQAGDEDHETRTTAKNVSNRNGDSSDHSLPRLDAPDFSTDGSSQARNDGVQELSPIAVPDQNDRSTVAGSTESQAKSSSDRMHVVQKGETLSSIAAKELGSSGRFHELFDANRDQLNDVNDVRVGMSLRIPARRTNRSESTASKNKASAPPLLPGDSGRNEIEELPPIGVNANRQPSSRPDNDPSPKKKFEPAKRPPVGIKGLGTQSGQLDEPTKPIRKLSQTPPKDVGGKVAR